MCSFQTLRVLTHLSLGDCSALSPMYGVLLICCRPVGQSQLYWQMLLFGTSTLARPVPSMSATIGIS